MKLLVSSRRARRRGRKGREYCTWLLGELLPSCHRYHPRLGTNPHYETRFGPEECINPFPPRPGAEPAARLPTLVTPRPSPLAPALLNIHTRARYLLCTDSTPRRRRPDAPQSRVNPECAPSLFVKTRRICLKGVHFWPLTLAEYLVFRVCA